MMFGYFKKLILSSVSLSLNKYNAWYKWAFDAPLDSAKKESSLNESSDYLCLSYPK